MNVNRIPGFGLGWLIALLVLIACFVIWVADADLSRDRILILIGAVAVSRLLP